MTYSAHALIDFYCGTGTDHRGRHLDELLGMDDRQFERTHDYIQWLFPLRTPSSANRHAPLLTDDERTWLYNAGAGRPYSDLVPATGGGLSPIWQGAGVIGSSVISSGVARGGYRHG